MDSALTTSDNLKHSEFAYWILKVGFVLAPVLAGIDKFFHYLTDWNQYLAPIFPTMLNMSPTSFMNMVGIIEIVAGIGVLLKPKIFAYVVCAWLAGIILNLLIIGGFYDVALRDLGLCIGAFALGQLSFVHEDVNKKQVNVIETRRHITT